MIFTKKVSSLEWKSARPIYHLAQKINAWLGNIAIWQAALV